MRLITACAAALALTLSGPAAAQSAQSAPTSPGEAAGAALYDFCLPLFGPGPMHADRLAATASMAGLQSAPRGVAPIGFPRASAAFLAPAPAGSNVLVFWIGDPGACQVIILGGPGAGDDLLGALTQLGWTPAQQNVQTGPDTAADVWTGQPRGYDIELVLVANKWVSDADPQGGVRVAINMMRAQ